jgi:drug/metabolite transporter (DMT)-like permease
MSFKHRIDGPGSAVLLLIVVSWSIGPQILHYFYHVGVSVWDQNFYRYLIAVFFVWLIVGWRYRRSYRALAEQLSRRTWLVAWIPTLPALGIQITLSWSLYHIQPGLMGLLSKQYVIWAVVLAMFVFPDERRLLRSRWFWTGLSAVIVGAVGVTVFKTDAKMEGESFGIFLVMILAISQALYGIAIRKFLAEIDTLVYYAVVATYNIPCLWLLSVLFGSPAATFHKGWLIWMLIVLSALLNIALTHLGYYWVIRRMGITVSQTVLMGTAFGAALLSFLVFDERLTLWQWFSGAILVCGAIITLLLEDVCLSNESRNTTNTR